MARERISFDGDSDRFDERELVEVERHNFEGIKAKLEPIEPETVILRMCEPGTGLGLSITTNHALDGVGPRWIVTVGDLVGDPNSGPGIEDGDFCTHGIEYSHR